MLMSPHLSVIIPTYQRRFLVERALQALAQQTMPPTNYEVIVSIDGSEDGTREMITQFPAPYRLHGLWQPNRGRAAACNAGIRKASGDVIVFLDDDMEAAPRCLAAHWQSHTTSKQLGVIGSAPFYLEPNSPPFVRYMSAGFNSRLERLGQPKYEISFQDAYTGNFSVRREVLLGLNGFDEDFKFYGYEDYELAWRLLQAGVRLIFCSDALAYQHYTTDFAQLARNTIGRGHAGVLFVGKHPEVYSSLKLSAYAKGSSQRQLFQTCLLLLSGIWAGTPEAVTAVIRWLELRRPVGVNFYYELAIEYFYRLGVRQALIENRRTGHGLTSLRLIDNMPKPGIVALPSGHRK